MRVVVTGVMNPHGAAVVRALAQEGHHVRAFGVPLGENPFADLEAVQPHPGRIDVTGSIEPVLSQRQVLVHCANLDAPGRDRKAHAFKIERGSLAARYGAEREQVDHFLALFPAEPDRHFAEVLAEAERTVAGTRGYVNQVVLEVADPEDAARQVQETIRRLPELGEVEGRNDAVTV